MRYELEALRREVDRLKYELTRKTEDENHQRLKHDVETIDRRIGNLESRVYEVERKLENVNFEHP